MIDFAISPVTAPGNTPCSPEHPGLRRLAFEMAAAAVVPGDRAAALRLIGAAR